MAEELDRERNRVERQLGGGPAGELPAVWLAVMGFVATAVSSGCRSVTPTQGPFLLAHSVSTQPDRFQQGLLGAWQDVISELPLFF